MSRILMANDARCPCDCENPCVLNEDLDRAEHEIQQLRAALERIRDCDFVITLPDRMDAVRQIAREALE